MENNLLSLIIFAPLAGAAINWFVGRRVRDERFIGVVAVRLGRDLDARRFLSRLQIGRRAASLRRPVLDHIWTWLHSRHASAPTSARDGSPERNVRALRHVRRLPDSRLRRRLHARRSRLLSLLRVSEPVHVRDADARAGGQLRADVCRLGRRGPLFVPADRLLLRSQGSRRRREESVHHEPHRRLGLRPRHHADVLRHRFSQLLRESSGG